MLNDKSQEMKLSVRQTTMKSRETPRITAGRSIVR
jgi:hypothetical protein